MLLHISCSSAFGHLRRIEASRQQACHHGTTKPKAARCAASISCAPCCPGSMVLCQLAASSRLQCQTAGLQTWASSSFLRSGWCGKFGTHLVPRAAGGGSSVSAEDSSSQPTKSAYSRHRPNPKPRLRGHTDSSGSISISKGVANNKHRQHAAEMPRLSNTRPEANDSPGASSRSSGGRQSQHHATSGNAQRTTAAAAHPAGTWPKRQHALPPSNKVGASSCCMCCLCMARSPWQCDPVLARTADTQLRIIQGAGMRNV